MDGQHIKRDKIELDFTKIFNDSSDQTITAPAENNSVEAVVPEQISEYEEQIRELKEKLKQAEDKAFALTKKRADDIFKVDQIQVEINKGIKAERDPKELLLKAMEAISIMIESPAHYDIAKKQIAECYK